MKNTMKNNTILKALTGILFVSVLTVGAFSFVPASVHAQDDGGDYSGGCCGDTGSYSTGIDYSSQPTYEQDSSLGSYSTGIDYSSEPSYATDGYSTSGYSTGGYSTGGYSVGGIGYSTGGGYSTPSYSNTYAPTTVTTNTNTCVGSNNCNTNVTNPAPIINNVVANYGGSNGYVAPTQYCASGYYGTYPNCYLLNQQPVVYQQPVVALAATPYVSLSQVPYTGLDLGFWGTIAYWGAMVLFALVVAYLVAIKRVQNTIALKLKHFLFGSVEAHEVVVTEAPAKVAYSKVQTSEDVIDSFIISQVNRPRHA